VIDETISHYKVTAKVGEGGMGVVYKAQDTKLDRPVALKFLAPHLLRDEEGRKRFEREAKAAAKLDYPNICTVYEIDEFNGRTFIAMAFLEGRTLSERIKEGPLKLPEALSIASQMAEGLEAAQMGVGSIILQASAGNFRSGRSRRKVASLSRSPGKGASIRLHRPTASSFISREVEVQRM